ncbi:MAG: DivIVA domain-containing protein [Acutalibacteraceae bacterium]|nr:DivIVA domain-containing protein [Acutalibacteraceae bacterium]
MLSSNDIRNIKFSKSVSGYKQEEVDIFLDKIEADYISYEKITTEFQQKIDTLNKEIDDYKNSQSSIQNVLLSAQKLADQIIEEAKEKSAKMISDAEEGVADINNKAKLITENFDSEFAAKKSAAENEILKMLENAQKKSDAITLAAADSVARQQALFDKLKKDIADFRAQVTDAYKNHLELLKQIPNSVSMEPKKVAEILSNEIDKEMSNNTSEAASEENVNTEE